MEIQEKTLNLVSEIINFSEAKNLNFYDETLSKISKIFSDSSLCLYFCEDNTYTLKSAIKNNEIYTNKIYINNLPIEDLIESNKKHLIISNKEDNFFNKNTLATKLAIRESVFGFCILSTNDKITDSIISSFCALINAISYKIKDYELNEVFKIQLKALQEAIIEKENAYEVIKKQHKKLQEMDKTKNLFIANISHELRTPLNAIIGFSQALDSKIFGELNEKQSEYIKDIQISSLHLLGMINDILDISKMEANAMKFNPTNVCPKILIQEVINILEPLYQNKNIKIIFNSKYDGEIKADSQKFQQILYNLLSNAIKYTNPDGKIEITSESENKNYYLKIKDNGIGIDKKFHTKIFKKFVHLSNVYTKNQKSTGLGLTITKELVKLHKGKITLDSEINKGSTFSMEFKNILI